MHESKKQSIVFVAHKFLPQPDDDLVSFLNREKYPNVLHIRHSFSDMPDRTSFYTWYQAGAVCKEEKTRDYSFLPEPLVYAKELYFTVWWIVKTKMAWDVYVGMDGLAVLFGNFLRFFSRVKKTIFWAIDFVPAHRFPSGLKNRIYQAINVHSYTHADEMWDLSPRMALAREKFLGIAEESYKKHRVVPYGMWTERITPYSYEQCEKTTLVFMGHLIEKQGVQLVLQALPHVLTHISHFTFKIIGEGQYREELIALARELGVLDACDFQGKIEDNAVMEKEIAKSAVAIAPYIRSLDTWTYFADPGKVKTYLACGVPLLLTDIPWNAKEIEEKECGQIITEDPKDIARKLLYLLEGQTNALYRKNAVLYAQGFNYANIFRDLL